MALQIVVFFVWGGKLKMWRLGALGPPRKKSKLPVTGSGSDRFQGVPVVEHLVTSAQNTETGIMHLQHISYFVGGFKQVF